MAVARGCLAAAGALAALVVLPATASAHALSGRVETPIPFWAFVAGAAIAVAVSFVLVIVGDPRPPVAGAERTATVPRVVRGILRALGLIGWLWIAAQTVIGGASDADVGSLFLWTYGWVGLAIVSAILGPVWSWLDPFTTLHDLGARAFRRLGIRGLVPAPWPERLGIWPAVAGFAVFVWIELVLQLRGGRLLGVVLLAYTGITLLGMAQYGRDAWRERGEVFSVWFRLLGRMARWAADGPPESGRVRRQGAIAGLIAHGWTPAAIVLVSLGTGSIIYDGLSQTQAFFDLFGLPGPLLGTLLIAAGLGALIAVVFGVARITGLPAMGAGLLPVALGYLVAHYLVALLVDGQRILIAISDPFQLGWDLFGTAFHEPSIDALPLGLLWTLQVGAVVLGHVAGAWAGHCAGRTAEGAAPRRAQVALALLMVGLTTLTLWSLGQNLVFEDTHSVPPAAAAIVRATA
ncbi:MAG: hypothetical protein ACKOTZ_01685 [Chloroflexota bacterium]